MSESIHSVLTPWDLMGYRPSGSAVHGIKVGGAMGKPMAVMLIFGRNQCNTVKQLCFS